MQLHPALSAAIALVVGALVTHLVARPVYLERETLKIEVAGLRQRFAATETKYTQSRFDLERLKLEVAKSRHSANGALVSSSACQKQREHERRQRASRKHLFAELTNGTVPVKRRPLSAKRLAVLQARHKKRKADMKAMKAMKAAGGAKGIPVKAVGKATEQRMNKK